MRERMREREKEKKRERMRERKREREDRVNEKEQTKVNFERHKTYKTSSSHFVISYVTVG